MRYFWFIVALFLVTLVQISIVEAHLHQMYLLNLPLLVVLFINWANPGKESILKAALYGWAISYFDGQLFGVTIFLFIITAIIVQYLSLHFLTNRTLPSLLGATLFGLIAYYVLSVAISTTNFGIAFDVLKPYLLTWHAIIYQLLLSSLVMLFLKLSVYSYVIQKTKKFT